MDHQTVKIYNAHDFERITRGIQVAQCMRVKSSQILDTEKIVNNLEDLVISDSLCCSYCSTVFENKAQQRSHYKLEWHRFNLKQHLHGLKSVSESSFNLIVDKNILSTSESELELQNEDVSSSTPVHWNMKNKRAVVRSKTLELKSESSEGDYIEEQYVNTKEDNLLSIGTRHSKVFFENEEGNIFSIYRCLLHNKKEVPEVDNEMIAQALESGKKSLWTIIMVGGGHFASAVYSDGHPLVHKTLHSYTVRAKQGSIQSSRDNRSISSYAKSAGANVRRYNESSLLQRVQKILEAWSTYIMNSSLILYRAVGPYNRSILFGGKHAPLDKNDSRLRPLPFPTRRATFNEVKRVYDVLSNMEIYGSAANFTNTFPISPRQPVRKKVLKFTSINEMLVNNENNINASYDFEYSCISSDKQKSIIIGKQNKISRINIDRAKPRKSPQRPLPDIVARLARSSSESEFDMQDNTSVGIDNTDIIEQNLVINFKNHLKSFEDTTPVHMKEKSPKRKRKSQKSKYQ